MLGTTDVFDHTDCGLPVATQVERLTRQVHGRFGDSLPVSTVDLYSLEGTERDEALDAVVAGDPSPFVLVGGHLVCTGNVDAPRVLESLVELLGGDVT